MKIAIVIADNETQVMMTPENDHERRALKFIEPGALCRVAMKQGQFDDMPTHDGVMVERCQGGYWRRFDERDSLMLVVTPREGDE